MQQAGTGGLETMVLTMMLLSEAGTANACGGLISICLMPDQHMHIMKP
jgi:hypothetical protein